jgi:integrase
LVKSQHPALFNKTISIVYSILTNLGSLKVRFTQENINLIQPRSYPFFLTDESAPAFAVKVQITGTKSFYYRKKLKGKRVDLPLGPDLAIARLKYIALTVEADQVASLNSTTRHGHSAAINQPPITSPQPANPLFYAGVSFAQLSSRFLAEHVEPNLTLATARNYRIYLNKVLFDLSASPLIAGRVSVDTARQDIKTYIQGMKTTTPVQANRIRETLSSCFKWGVYEDLCYASPVFGIRVFKETPKSRRFNQAELPDFFTALREGNFSQRSANCLRLILATGLRAGEALSIEPQHIDWNNEILLIPHTKNGEPFVVPLVGLTKELLLECVEEWPAGRRLFPVSIFGLRQVCRRASEKAGITLCSTHDLRRTFGTLLGELGVGVPVIGRCLNHSAGGSVTTRVYALHDMLNEKREALLKVADRLSYFGCLSTSKSMQHTTSMNDAKVIKGSYP